MRLIPLSPYLYLSFVFSTPGAMRKAGFIAGALDREEVEIGVVRWKAGFLTHPCRGIPARSKANRSTSPSFDTRKYARFLICLCFRARVA